MGLPNPSMTFTPFDILTAAEMNDLVENDQALAAGTGFNTGAIPEAALAAGSVANSKLKTGAGEPGGAWNTWTATPTNLTVGNGVVTSFYKQIGKTIVARYDLVFGTTTSVSGDIRLTLPVTNASYGGVGAVQIGSVNLFDTSASRLFQGTVNLGSGVCVVRPQAADLTYVYGISASATVPFTWATGDEIGLTVVYEAA